MKESEVTKVTVEFGNFPNRMGRGAYVCYAPKCAEEAVKKGRIEKTLKTRIVEMEVNEIRRRILELQNLALQSQTQQNQAHQIQALGLTQLSTEKGELRIGSKD